MRTQTPLLNQNFKDTEAYNSTTTLNIFIFSSLYRKKVDPCVYLVSQQTLMRLTPVFSSEPSWYFLSGGRKLSSSLAMPRCPSNTASSTPVSPVSLTVSCVTTYNYCKLHQTTDSQCSPNYYDLNRPWQVQISIKKPDNTKNNKHKQQLKLIINNN